MRVSPIPVALLLAVGVVSADQPKPAPAVTAAPAVPAKPSAGAAPKAPALISSELSGRDLVFIANGLDLGNALKMLAGKAAQTTNPNLKGFGEELTQTLEAHAAVLETVAEMRQLTPPKVSPTEKRLADKLGKLEGLKLEKAILDSFIDVEERLMATYALGAKSTDPTIAKFVEQAIPQTREHLLLVRSMAGIAPSRAADQLVKNSPAAPAPTPSHPPEPAPKETALPAEKPAPAVAAQPEAEPPKVAAQKPSAPSPTSPAKDPARETMPPKAPAVAEVAKHQLPPEPKPAKPAPSPAPEDKPAPIGEPPPPDELGPKKLEGEKPPPPKRPAFRTNVKPLPE
jgi:hypothetical protein